MRFVLSLLCVACFASCQSSDPPIKLQEREADPLVVFSSATDHPTTGMPAVQLRLLTDSTFRLRVGERVSGKAELQGKFSANDQYYHLFFKDSVSQLNELITSVHTDGSVVVYPDHSVVLDRSLLQFYVQGALVAKDTTAVAR